MLGEGVTSSSVSLAPKGHVCSHDPSSDSEPDEPEHSGIPSKRFQLNRFSVLDRCTKTYFLNQLNYLQLPYHNHQKQSNPPHCSGLATNLSLSAFTSSDTTSHNFGAFSNNHIALGFRLCGNGKLHRANLKVSLKLRSYVSLYSLIRDFGKSQHKCKWFNIQFNFSL